MEKKLKIAYIIPWGSLLSGKSNGVRMQAEGWAEELKRQGHQVTLVDMWGDYSWKDFDIIHLFGMSLDVPGIIAALKQRSAASIVFSPIIDTNRAWWLSWLAHFASLKGLHMISPWSELYAIARQGVFFFARSKYEKMYIEKALRVPTEKIFTVPLSFRMSSESSPEREKFCLHISLLSGPHKNVKRLIQAAIKFNFKLVLAGKYGSEDFKRYLDETIRQHPNISYLGRVSDEELFALYNKAKCFALPSIFEGVGLVALDAAACGCDIVLTDRGAPKEYYNGKAFLVNPESVDDIGGKIAAVLNGESHQPELSRKIKNDFSLAQIVSTLAQFYNSQIALANGSATAKKSIIE